ncbi:hypothetical protein EC957_003674 [Mortierella hygrophila]|uniref:Exosome complex protein n=1 Tax=Mortierella hygrophila TaxID=979708 RepID=A0A9P6F2H5_9FUNG|nr:hypothetical protein EC957_003674 [Mortierella hygrophila]
MPPKITQQQQQQEPLSQTLSANHRNATNALLASLAGLESMLAPLFASTSALSETVAKLDTEKRCQLELLLAYALNTLVFINLKTNGTAPASHPVMHELKRIKGYTEKLRQVTQGAPTSTMEVNKDAAARFIKGALAANLVADRKAAEEQDPQGTHVRFEHGSSSTITTTTTAVTTGTSSSSSSTSPSAKAAAAETETAAAQVGEESSAAGQQQQPQMKKRAMDPFHGYDGNKKSKP